jgi:hypothetical protein
VPGWSGKVKDGGVGRGGGGVEVEGWRGEEVEGRQCEKMDSGVVG